VLKSSVDVLESGDMFRRPRRDEVMLKGFKIDSVWVLKLSVDALKTGDTVRRPQQADVTLL